MRHAAKLDSHTELIQALFDLLKTALDKGLDPTHCTPAEKVCVMFRKVTVEIVAALLYPEDSPLPLHPAFRHQFCCCKAH